MTEEHSLPLLSSDGKVSFYEQVYKTPLDEGNSFPLA